ncbi:MAG: dTDP-4-dehydrorhamnose reductase [Candidatus Neomarinimicrobiota bacterium]
MKILITGANGMLGEKCAKLLSGSHQVLATDLADKLIYEGDLRYRSLDITNPGQVSETITDFQPDKIINCAAYTDVDGSEIKRDLAWSVNVGGVQNMIATLNPNTTSLIHISTDYVFDGIDGPYRENDPVKPINYYGETKLNAEKTILDSGTPATIIRTNVVFGNSANQEASFVYWVVKKLSRREPINVVNDQFGNPTWADGLAEIIEIFVNRQIRGIYNYGGADYINRLEFALQIAAVFDLDPRLIRATSTSSLGQKAPRPFRAGLICDKIQNELGVQLYSISAALKTMKGITT